MENFKVKVLKGKNLLGWRLKIVDSDNVQITVGRFENWEKIIEQKKEWILHQLTKMPVKKSLLSQKVINFLGEEYSLNISLGKSDSLIFFDEQKEVHVRVKTVTDNYIKKMIDKKIRTKALKIIRDKTKELAKKFDITIGDIKIKNQKTRFGSCAGNGNLNFNWQIILFPVDKFEHVILHELTHILEHNHSHRFWGKLQEMDNNCYQNNQWLKTSALKYFII
ncbi:MAG: YgjP-like metallopeptidase domain-containing protein [Candidatus Shapirobacteria bacterium]